MFVACLRLKCIYNRCSFTYVNSRLSFSSHELTHITCVNWYEFVSLTIASNIRYCLVFTLVDTSYFTYLSFVQHICYDWWYTYVTLCLLPLTPVTYTLRIRVIGVHWGYWLLPPPPSNISHPIRWVKSLWFIFHLSVNFLFSLFIQPLDFVLSYPQPSNNIRLFRRIDDYIPF